MTTTPPAEPDSLVARSLGALRVATGVLLFLLVSLAVVASWDDVSATIRRLNLYEVLLSEALVILGLFLSVLTWRVALSELGSWLSVRSASPVYLIGQLGKYLPGSVWAIAAQGELAHGAGVGRSRAVSASIIAMGVNLVVGLLLGVALVPSVSSENGVRAIALVALAALCLVALTPPVIERVANLGLRLLRRAAVPKPMSWRGVGTATAWSVASAACYGASVWLLAVGAGAPAGKTLLLCLSGVPLAMAVGFLVFLAPSGIGVREAVIVVALSPVLDRSDGLAVALAARFLFTAADLLAALSVLPFLRRRSIETS